MKLASGPQLRRLNQSGRLRLTLDAEAKDVTSASSLLAAIFADSLAPSATDPYMELAGEQDA
jgi:hypothetical protein